MLHLIERASKKINEYAAIVSGILLLLVAGAISAFATGRAFHEVVWFHMYYYAEVGMAWLIFIALAYALITGAHVKVTLLEVVLPSRVRQWLRVVVYAIGTSFFALCTVAAWPHIVDSIRLGERVLAPMGINVPLWLAKISMGIGFTLILIQFAIELIHTMRVDRR